MDFCICDALKMILVCWRLVFDEINCWPFLQSCSDCALVIVVLRCLFVSQSSSSGAGRSCLHAGCWRESSLPEALVCLWSYLKPHCVGPFCHYIIFKLWCLKSWNLRQSQWKLVVYVCNAACIPVCYNVFFLLSHSRLPGRILHEGALKSEPN